MLKFTQDELDKINNIPVLAYFEYLEMQDKVKFERKTGHDVYYRTKENKFSVSDKTFFDFKKGEGGKIIKAVMYMENKSWRDAVLFLQNFTNLINHNDEIKERNRYVSSKPISSIPLITNKVKPNNDKLLDYFFSRGIDKEILENFTQQVHYEIGDKKYFGIGMENKSHGFEIRNPMLKTKIGKGDISVIEGNKNELILFEGMTDTLSFLQLLKNNNTENNRNLVTLNSVVNVDKFIETYKDYTGKIFLCLDGDKSGNETTNKILESLSTLKIKDIRPLYQISETQNNDLNNYLTTKSLKNELATIHRPNTISTPIQDGTQKPFDTPSAISQKNESQQETNSGSRHRMGSNDVGNGFGSRTSTNDNSDRGESPITTQSKNDTENENQQDSLELRITEISDLQKFVLQNKKQKLDNKQIEILLSQLTYISDDNKILLYDHVEITDDIKEICNQYKSGGTTKNGRGILDEYYTSLDIVDSIRNLLKDTISQKPFLNVLEPSIGTGNFLNAVESLPIQSFVTGFEINEATAKIAKILHPNADINFRAFETEFITDNGHKIDEEIFLNKYDLVIGNPPYGQHRGLYKGLGEESKISRYEDYFVKKGLDVLKEGGVLAMILPSTWLGRQNSFSGAVLKDAFRLPSGAFKGTKVGTDIIIIEKKQLQLSQDISSYFETNPQKILGEIRERSGRFGRSEVYVHGSLEDALQKIHAFQNNSENERIGNLFEDLKIDDEKPTIIENKEDVQKPNLQNDHKTIEKTLIILNSIKFKSPAIQLEIQKFENLLNSLDTLSDDMLSNAVQNAQKIFDFHSSKNVGEYTVQNTPTISKKILKYQFFKEDEIVPASLQNSHDITPEQIEAFKDCNYDGTLNNHIKHAQFANFINGEWVHDFYYAEGNIYEKLDSLERDFSDKFSVGGLDNQYEKQKELLESVLPKPKSLEQISLSPNHDFIHHFYLEKKDKEIFNYRTAQSETVTVDYYLSDKFKDFVSNLPTDAFRGSSSWEVKSFVDNESVTGSDKERNALVRERRKQVANYLFNKFIKEELSDDLQKRFVDEFNKQYNNIHVPDYSKFPLFSNIHKNFKGKELRLTEVQKSGIGRQTTKGVGLLGHEVGFGKTLSAILSFHEAMERNNAKRPLICVPNDAILKQWVDTIFEVIPNAKVNVLGNLGKEYDLSKFDNKDGEITIVTYEGFNNIGFSKEMTENLASKFSYISTNELKGIINSERNIQLELQKEKELEGKMKRGKVYDWEDFGFDHFTVDEVHKANHIVGKVKIEDRRFASDFRNQNQQTSKLGINTWMACQYIQNKYDGRNVTLLSATPFTNKPLEYYSILSLIANKRLEESGYFNVNTFFETFMEADNDMEIDAKGDVKFKANVRRFKNNSLFQQLLSEFIDIKGEEDNLELIRPNKINKEYKIEQNDLTKEQYELLNESFSETEKGAILTHILNARLIAISPYLSPYYDGESPTLKEFVENSPKLNETMDLIRQNKKDIPDSGQIIYSELAVAEFPKLKEYLVKEVGYQPEEVGIITGATSKNQRISIQNDFNSGKIKVVIGSEAIQEGMNLQENTTDLYLLSLPYNFTSLRQVEGRAWRQGNVHDYVRCNFMLTNDSIDVFMLQKLQSKQARYLEAMKKGADVLDVSDISTQELKTSIITSPITRANIEIEVLKKRLEKEKGRFLADNAFVMRKYQDFIKVKEELTKAEDSYNRILGYSKDEEDGSYWINLLPSHERTVELAKKDVQKTIVELAQKGVNVAEIEKQTELTDSKVLELDKRLDELPTEREHLINKYTLEKQEKLEKASKIDIIKERHDENKLLFCKHIPTIEVNEKIKKGGFSR